MSKEKVIDISTRKTGKIVGICAAAVAAIIVVVSSVSIVPAGCTGVVTTFGKVSDTALNEASESAFCTACNNSVKQDTSLSG